MHTGIDRHESGHEFKWYARPGIWATAKGNMVLVVPPGGQTESWLVILPDNGEVHELDGNEAEQRAFAIAGGFARQDRSTVVR